MIRQQNAQGFTLIGLLAIIAVVAIISVYALSLGAQQDQQKNISKTIIEIKHWQEAGLGYWSRNVQWPSSGNNATPVALLQSGGYMPPGAECSPWPGDNTSASFCPHLALYQVTSSATAPYFTVSVQVPNAAIAQEIAAQLPMAEVSNSNGIVMVNSSVPQPTYRRGWITAAGVVDSMAGIYLPNCPAGYEGHYIMSPQYFVTGSSQNPGGAGAQPLLPYAVLEMGFGTLSGNQVALTNHLHSPTNDTFYHSYFLTFCIPAGTWWVDGNTVVQSTQFSNGKGQIYLNDLQQVRQCSTNWKNYNRNQSTGCP